MAGEHVLARDVPLGELGMAAESRALRARVARRDVTERRRVTMRLREALATGGFVLHYQPHVYLKSGLTGGAEALIRLQHRRRGLIMPSHFMPVAERSDVVNEIGAWVLMQACREAILWPGHLTIAVGLSHRQLRSGRLIALLIKILAETGISAPRLELDLTEAMLIDNNEDTAFALQAIRGLGVSMALRDFGTGYASLSALRRLPISTLKLDRSLVHYLGQDHAQTAIVHAAIEAGHALGCAVLADGVESLTQFRILQEIGCDEAQGPYFSLPMPSTQLRAKLNQP